MESYPKMSNQNISKGVQRNQKVFEYIQRYPIMSKDVKRLLKMTKDLNKAQTTRGHSNDLKNVIFQGSIFVDKYVELFSSLVCKDRQPAIGFARL